MSIGRYDDFRAWLQNFKSLGGQSAMDGSQAHASAAASLKRGVVAAALLVICLSNAALGQGTPGTPGPNGADGAAPGIAGGAGGPGGDGGPGSTAAPTIVNSATISGGVGGGGGSGGSGAAAAVVILAGGAGGDGGNGGNGGVGIGGSNLTITNSGSIVGGAGGNGGSGGFGGASLAGIGGAGGNGGNGGSAGVGISGSDLTIFNSGTIAGAAGGVGGAGGLGGAGTTAGATGVGGAAGSSSAAIVFTGGVNVLELQSGSTITGAVVAFSAADTLQLGGSANASFDVTQIGAQYQNFGKLAKTGTSTWTLTGAGTTAAPWSINGGLINFSTSNNFGTGNITLNGGGLQWAAGNTTDISGRLNAIGAGGGTIDTNGNDVTFASALSGGAITKQGAGTLVLSVANSQSGLTVAAGTLQISGAGTLGSAAGAVTVSGGTLDLGGTTQTQDGGLTLTGGTIKNGTLSSSGTFGVQSGTVSAVLAGAGALDKTGAGTVTLTGANTYTGITDIHGGTLAIGAGGSLAGLVRLDTAGASFDISAGKQTIKGLLGVGGTSVALGASTLTIDTPNSGGFQGVLTGTGGIVVKGGGTLTLNGVSTYSGTTTIADGLVAVGAGGSIASSGGLRLTTAAAGYEAFSTQSVQNLAGVAGSTLTVTGGNTLTLDDGRSTTFAGSLGGSGGLVKDGVGTLTLTGDSSAFTGSTTIDAGAVALGTSAEPDASLGGDVMVAGGTLKGFGTIGGALSNTGGVVAVGRLGTLTVGGDFTQGSAGTLSIEISPTAASRLSIGGAASLDGKLALIFDPGVYHATSYKLLTANSVTGKFSSVTGTNPSGLDQTVLYDAKDVTLQLSSTPKPVVVVPTNDTIYTAATSIAIMSAQSANMAILEHRGDDSQAAVNAPSPTARGAWFHAIGGFASVNGGSSAPGYTGQAGGFLAGYDQAVTDDAYLGLAGGYQHSNVAEHSPSSGLENSIRIALYGGVAAGPGLFTGTVGYAHDWLDTTRTIAGIGKAQESHSGDEATVAGQWTMPIRIKGLGGRDATLSPKAGFQFVHLSEDGFGENGARGFDLASGGRDTDSFQPFIGATAAQTFVTDSGMNVTPDLHVGYGHEVLSNARKLTVTTVSGDDFLVVGVKPSRDQVSAGFGLNLASGPNFSLYARYDSIFYTGNTSYQDITAGVRWRF